MNLGFLTLIAAIICVVIPSNSYGFAEWRVNALPSLTEPLGTYIKSVHHSDASEEGQVSIVFVRHSLLNGIDSLYLVSYGSMYEKHPSSPSASFELIDSAKEISSVQIRRDPSTGYTHFAYSLKRDTTPQEQQQLGYPPVIEVLRHTVYRRVPNSMIAQIVREDVAKRTILVGNPYGVSFKLRPSLSQTYTPAIAYHSSTPATQNSTLFYAERNGATWTTQQIDSGPQVGANCDLAFEKSGVHSAIAYQEGNGQIIHLARRSYDGPWSTGFAVLGLGSEVSDPSLVLVSSFAQIAYISRSSSTYGLTYRAESLGGTNFTTVMSGPREISSPQMVLSDGRAVISYGLKETGPSGDFEPWVATKSRIASSFTFHKLPQLRNDPGIGDTSVSLDAYGYPLITWGAATGGEPRVCYSPDFTDLDCDGVTYLEEVAFGMDPNTPDAHLLPKTGVSTVTDSAMNSTDHLDFVFPTVPLNPVINPVRPIIDTTKFCYKVFRSHDMQNWEYSEVDIIQLQPRIGKRS